MASLSSSSFEGQRHAFRQTPVPEGVAGSGSSEVVLVDDAAEHVVPDDRVGGKPDRRLGKRRSESEPSVRSRLVVVVEVLGDDRFEVPSAEDERPVQALPPHASHPALGERVRPSRQLLPMVTVRPEPSGSLTRSIRGRDGSSCSSRGATTGARTGCSSSMTAV